MIHVHHFETFTNGRICECGETEQSVLLESAEREVIEAAIQIVDEWDSSPMNASRMNACRQGLQFAVRALREARDDAGVIPRGG